MIVLYQVEDIKRSARHPCPDLPALLLSQLISMMISNIKVCTLAVLSGMICTAAQYVWDPGSKLQFLGLKPPGQ